MLRLHRFALCAVVGGLILPASALAAPAAPTLVSPADGAVYDHGESVTVDWECPTDPGVTCTADAAAGSLLDTNTDGHRSFTVTATDAADASTQTTNHFDVRPVCDDVPDAEAVAGDVVRVHLTCSSGTLTVDTTTADGSVTYDDATGTATYSPDPNFSGTDTFPFTSTTADGVASAPATVTVKVVPHCDDATATTPWPLPATVTFTCTGDPTGLRVVTDPNHGPTPTTSGLSATYRATPGYTGSDTFEVVAESAGGDSAPATASIAVTGYSAGGGGGDGGDLGGGGDGGPWVSGLVPDPEPSVPDRLPTIPFLPSLFGPGGANKRAGTASGAFGRATGVIVSKAAVRASRSGRVRLRVRNANAFAVRARLTLHGAYRRDRKGRRVARLSAGRSALTLRARRTASVTVTLDRAERALLRRLHRTTLDVALRVADARGTRRTVRSKLTLRAP